MIGHRVVVVALVAFLSAGCLDNTVDPAEQNGGAADMPLLADFTECDFTYPDNGSTIACEDLFKQGTVAGTEQPTTIPTGWVCTHRGGSEREGGTEYWMHWHPVEERFGVYYEIRSPVSHSVSGFLYNTVTQEGVAWHGGNATGFVEVPDPDRNELRLRIYSHWYESPTPALQGGQIKAVWSVHNGVPYPLQVLTTSEETYYFNNVTGGLLTEDYYRYDVERFSKEGADFNITVGYEVFFDRGTFMKQEPRLGCATM